MKHTLLNALKNLRILLIPLGLISMLSIPFVIELLLVLIAGVGCCMLEQKFSPSLRSSFRRFVSDNIPLTVEQILEHKGILSISINVLSVLVLILYLFVNPMKLPAMLFLLLFAVVAAALEELLALAKETV